MLKDNKTRLSLIKDLKNQNCSKYINVIYYHIQGMLENRELGIEWIFNLLILADSFTKLLFAKVFKRH